MVMKYTSSAGVAQGSIKEAVKGVKALETQAGFGSALLEQMSHAHPQPGSANDGSVQRYSSCSKHTYTYYVMYSTEINNK